MLWRQPQDVSGADPAPLIVAHPPVPPQVCDELVAPISPCATQQQHASLLGLLLGQIPSRSLCRRIFLLRLDSRQCQDGFARCGFSSLARVKRLTARCTGLGLLFLTAAIGSGVLYVKAAW